MSHHRDRVLAVMPRASFVYAVSAGVDRNIDMMFADALLSLATAQHQHREGSVREREHLIDAIAALICLVADLNRLDDEASSTVVKPEAKA